VSSGIDMYDMGTGQGETGKQRGLFFVDDGSNLWLSVGMVWEHTPAQLSGLGCLSAVVQQ
jgi:hypothetical protein